MNFICVMSENHDEIIDCLIGGIVVQLLIDSGSRFNILDEATWSYLQNSSASIRDVRRSNRSLSAYAQDSNLEILHEFDSTIQIPGTYKMMTATFLVVKHGRKSLLGRESSKALGVLRLGLSLSQVNCVETLVPFPKIKGNYLTIVPLSSVNDYRVTLL